MNAIALADVVALPLATFAYPAGHPRAGSPGLVRGFAIRHARGVFLVDTGFAEGSAEVDARYVPARRDIVDALREAGIEREDVAAIANSHLHFDHIGGNRRFPGVSIYVQRVELEAARAGGYTVLDALDFPGARYEVLEGDAEPLLGIRVLATGGHTAGSQAVVVESDEGRIVVGFHSAPEWALGLGGERLRALCPRRVLFAHDERVWERP